MFSIIRVYLSCLLHSLNPDGQSIYSVKDSERIVLSYDLALGGIGNWIFEVHTDLNNHIDCELKSIKIFFFFFNVMIYFK